MSLMPQKTNSGISQFEVATVQAYGTVITARRQRVQSVCNDGNHGTI